MTTVQDGLRDLIAQLKREDVPDAPREARLILAHAMGVPHDRLNLLAYDPLPDTVLEHASVMAVQRCDGKPISQILGRRSFFGRDFYVNEQVLDPRPETECLIIAALEEGFDTLLDLGTGSGAIAVTLLAERRMAVGVATDLSERALAVAKQNAQTHGVTDRSRLATSDWFASVSGTYDLIVSNPPYIAADEMAGLQSGVRDYEPRLALTDEGDGLSAYRIICRDAPVHLAAGGRLIVEIGPTQANAVSGFMENAGLTDVRVLQDLDGRDRNVVGRMPRS